MNGMSLPILIFAIVLTIVALITKVIGCGGIARLCKFSTTNSLKIGVEMMNRGEVALIVADRGIFSNILSKTMNVSIVPLIIITLLATPIFFKILYAKRSDNKVKSKNHSQSDKNAITYTEIFREKQVLNNNL